MNSAASTINKPRIARFRPGRALASSARRKFSKGITSAAPSSGPAMVPTPPISDSSANFTPTSGSVNRVGGSM